jgi:UDP-3-O-[3-hydroxymyristoyl] glucosamine N-acyltransferase
VAVTLGEIQAALGAELSGDRERLVSAVNTLANAGPSDVAFIADKRYAEYLPCTRAGAVILAAELRDVCPVNALVVKDPYAAYARAAQLLYPAVPGKPGKDPSAQVAADSEVDPSASIGSFSVISAGALIGPGVTIGPGCFVDSNVVIGAGSTLVARVTLRHGTRIGERSILHPGVVIGSDGFGFAYDGKRWIKIPQIGGVRIGDDVEIGANTAIDRGAIEDTIIEDGVKLDNLIQVAHNVRIGAHTVIAGCTGIAGSTTIGCRCAIGGMVGITGHISIADDVRITGRSFVSQSITEAGSYSSGSPLDETQQWRKNFVRMKQLDDMARRIKDLERRLGRDTDDHD